MPLTGFVRLPVELNHATYPIQYEIAGQLVRKLDRKLILDAFISDILNVLAAEGDSVFSTMLYRNDRI